jgi:hypothetical protein
VSRIKSLKVARKKREPRPVYVIAVPWDAYDVDIVHVFTSKKKYTEAIKLLQEKQKRFTGFGRVETI